MTPRQEEVRRLALSGLLNTEIAVQLGITRQSVHELLKATGTPSNSHPKPTKYDADVIRLHGMGWSQYRIAKELGIARSLVSNRILRLGLRSSTSIGKHDEQIVQLYNDGLTVRDVASTLKVSPSTVMNAFSRMKIERRRSSVASLLSDTETVLVAQQSRDGVSVSDVARQFNCSETTVCKIRKQFGIQRSKSKAKQ